MSDSFRRVVTGEPLRFPARLYNTLVEVAADYQASRFDSGGNRGTGPRGTVLVRNDSGADRDQFDVLGVSAPLILPSANEKEFRSRVAFKGATPTTDHLGRFAVLLEPVKQGDIGPACVAGVCIVHVDVQDEDHRFADVKDGDASCLESCAAGAAQILWKESGTGLKWAVVRLVALPPVTFPVTVTKDGGVAGDANADCSFTYTVKDLAGFELETNLTPECPRLPKTEYAQPGADSPAVAYYDLSGSLHLYHVASEVPVTDVAEVITSFRYDTESHKFQLKRTSVRVLEKADEDTDWTDVVVLTECDDT